MRGVYFVPYKLIKWKRFSTRRKEARQKLKGEKWNMLWWTANYLKFAASNDTMILKYIYTHTHTHTHIYIHLKGLRVVILTQKRCLKLKTFRKYKKITETQIEKQKWIRLSSHKLNILYWTIHHFKWHSHV